MLLSVGMEYGGQCKEVLDFYASVFPDASVMVRNYKEMPNVGFRKLYGDERSFEELRLGEYPDKYGIRWSYEYDTETGICYCLEFDGFCADVIAYYENAFDIIATEVVRYAETPYADTVEGKDKIYNALLEFTDDGRKYAIKLRDSMNSAVHDLYEYDSKQLLFYQMLYNPILNFSDKDKEYLQDSFRKLSVGAKLNKPFVSSENADVCGSLIDKYGICWNFNNS